jgi:hypothetical protein
MVHLPPFVPHSWVVCFTCDSCHRFVISPNFVNRFVFVGMCSVFSVRKEPLLPIPLNFKGYITLCWLHASSVMAGFGMRNNCIHYLEQLLLFSFVFWLSNRIPTPVFRSSYFIFYCNPWKMIKWLISDICILIWPLTITLVVQEVRTDF